MTAGQFIAQTAGEVARTPSALAVVTDDHACIETIVLSTLRVEVTKAALDQTCVAVSACVIQQLLDEHDRLARIVLDSRTKIANETTE